MKRDTANCFKFAITVTLTLLQSTAVLLAEENRNRLPRKQHKYSDAPFLTPEQAVKEMAIPDGFDVSIFASEPHIAEPIAFCLDDRGRMWVAENFNYQTRRKHTDDPVSRIQILEDTDGDGVFDKKKTFIDTLTFTSGMACGFGGVFVGSPPNLTFIPDADRDDKPDGPPEILLDGWGIRDRHETLNSFNWGPDGWLYGCHGVFTHSNVGKPGALDHERQFIDAGVWRYHPTRKTFEIFARGLSNPWGFDFNDHGQGFATCCVIPHLFHVVQGGTYHKQSRQHVNPYVYDHIKTIRDHTPLSAHGGARFYLADVFPAKYRDRLFMCNIHEHAVLTNYMVPKGSSFIGRHGDDFMPANDMAWVGFSVETGPEGGIYILDWHDQDVCGNAVKFPNSGRIYHVMPKGSKTVARPNLEAMSDKQLVELQMHSNDWFVRRARTLLQWRADSGRLNRSAVHEPLRNMLATAPNAPKKLRALWALFVTGGLDQDALGKLLQHDDEHIRAWAIQLLCDTSGINAFEDVADDATSPIGPDLLKRFARMALTDPSQIVRLYLASAAQRLPFEQRWPILSGLVSHAEDISDNNLPRMYWFALEPMVPHHPKESLALATAGRIPALPEFVARRLVTEDGVTNTFSRVQNGAEFDRRIQAVARGFRVSNPGEGGVVRHSSFRNAVAVQTHPLDEDTPCILNGGIVDIPVEKKTTLKMRVSHHPHGDWKLRVIVDGKPIAEQIVSSETVSDDEWLDVNVDLTKYAGKHITLGVENRANNWHNEWAYWNSVSVVSE